MKYTIRIQLTEKLNAISGIIKQCALQVFKIQHPPFMHETTLAAITHESLCELLERDGENKQTLNLINDFGKAVVQLYDNIINFKPATNPLQHLETHTPDLIPGTKIPKTLLN